MWSAKEIKLQEGYEQVPLISVDLTTTAKEKNTYITLACLLFIATAHQDNPLGVAASLANLVMPVLLHLICRLVCALCLFTAIAGAARLLFC